MADNENPTLLEIQSIRRDYLKCCCCDGGESGLASSDLRLQHDAGRTRWRGERTVSWGLGAEQQKACYSQQQSASVVALLLCCSFSFLRCFLVKQPPLPHKGCHSIWEAGLKHFLIKVYLFVLS